MNNTQYFLITICARGGSKGIPGKNIKILNGIPLIAYTINVAKQFKAHFRTVDIVLSTDSNEILDVAKQYEIETDYVRPAYLANDTAGKIDAIRDVLNYSERINRRKYDVILDLDVTSPLRNLKDLIEALNLLMNNDSAINLFSVSPASRSPYFNMVEKKSNGFYSQVVKPHGDLFTRQSAPKVYDLNASFYFYKREFFESNYTGAITEKSLIYEVPHVCFDLDHPIDFEIITFLMEKKQLDFDL